MEINALCGIKYCFYNFVFNQCTKCRKSSLVPKTYTYRKENVTYPSGTHAFTTVFRWGSGCFTFSFQVVVLSRPLHIFSSFFIGHCIYCHWNIFWRYKRGKTYLWI